MQRFVNARQTGFDGSKDPITEIGGNEKSVTLQESSTKQNQEDSNPLPSGNTDPRIASKATPNSLQSDTSQATYCDKTILKQAGIGPNGEAYTLLKDAARNLANNQSVPVTSAKLYDQFVDDALGTPAVESVVRVLESPHRVTSSITRNEATVSSPQNHSDENDMAITKSDLNTIIRKLETYISTRAIVVQENKVSDQETSKFKLHGKKTRIPNSPYKEFGLNNKFSIETYTKEGRLSSMYIKHGEKYYTSSHGNVELTLARTKNVLVTISLLKDSSYFIPS